MTDLPDGQRSSVAPDERVSLSSVIDVVLAALKQARSALSDASACDSPLRAGALQQAQMHLQQAAGALQAARVDGAELLLPALALALQRFADGTLDCSAAHARTVLDLVWALGKYLQQLNASTAPARPLLLFPYYQPLLALLGCARIHPADLFFPDLTLAVVIEPALDPIAADYPTWRQRFEKSLLPFMKEGALPDAGALRDVVVQVAQAQVDAPARTFWCALQGFSDLVAGGQLASSLYVKQLFGLINLQMRRQSQGGSELPQAMLRDALFFIAAHASSLEPNLEPLPEQDMEQGMGQDMEQAAHDASSILQQLLRGYALAGMVPPDFELRRYERAWPPALSLSASANEAGAALPSNVIDFPLLPASGAAQDEPMQQIGKLAISLATHRAYLSGTDLLLRLLTQDFGEWRHEPQRAASGAALLAARTLAETSGALGFHAMWQLAQALEMALHAARARKAPALVLNPAQRDLLECVLECCRLMLHHFALGDLPAGQGELLAALQQLCVQLQSAPRPAALAPGTAPSAELAQQESAPQSSLDANPRVALVRVRADILGRIALQAGAVSSARVSLEEDVVTLRTALSDFSTSLSRLRRQLRDVEMQAEAQIASRMAIANAGQFDPLEFDRCARLQELTRIMAESVSDVTSIHQNLMHGVEIGSRHLQQQAGLTRAMQSDLAMVQRAPTGSALRRAAQGAKGALAP